MFAFQTMDPGPSGEASLWLSQAVLRAIALASGRLFCPECRAGIQAGEKSPGLRGMSISCPSKAMKMHQIKRQRIVRSPRTQIVQKLRCWLDAGDQQVIPGPRAGDIEQMPLGVPDMKFCIFSDPITQPSPQRVRAGGIVGHGSAPSWG